MSDNKLPFEEFVKLTSKQRGIAYKYMSDHDKFRARITEIIGEPNTTKEEREEILKKYGIEIKSQKNCLEVNKLELDSKQEVLYAIYAEYQKDLPDMKNITYQSLDMDLEVFQMALIKLQNEGFIIPNEELKQGE